MDFKKVSNPKEKNVKIFKFKRMELSESPNLFFKT
jgi:hypothetical protein